MSSQPAIVALEDGTTFEGFSFGHEGEQHGEIVFNTSMTGYQEVLTDPSYKGQIVTMTYPLIGNYGINDEDVESDRIFLEGFLIKESVENYEQLQVSEIPRSLPQRKLRYRHRRNRHPRAHTPSQSQGRHERIHLNHQYGSASCRKNG